MDLVAVAINIYTVQADAAEHNWQLISTSYKNLKTPLDFKCPKGHEVSITYEDWRKHHNCPECLKAEADNVRRNKLPKKTTAFRVLALDAATGTTGYSIYDDKKLVAYGTFTTLHTEDPAPRINQVKKWLEEICETCQPDAVGVEGIQYQKNVKMFQTLANLQGVIIDFLYENRNKYKYKVASSSTWRSYLGINFSDERENAKAKAQQYVKLMYSLTVSQDEADAICMGKYFADQFNSKPKIIWGEDIL